MWYPYLKIVYGKGYFYFPAKALCIFNRNRSYKEIWFFEEIMKDNPSSRRIEEREKGDLKLVFKGTIRKGNLRNCLFILDQGSLVINFVIHTECQEM